ncbi:MAG: hypothetical protein AAF515_21105 [Pseudomonadota bacterium]
MSQVEMVMTGYSIIIALCLARLLDGLRPAAAAGARYWVHYVWLINKIVNVVLLYWGTYYFLEESLSLAEFMLVLAPPSIVYLQCDALLTKDPDSITDWRAHYYRSRTLFFFANCLLVPLILGQIMLTSDGPLPFSVPAALALMGAVSLLGALSASPRLHAGIAVVALLNLTIGFTVQFSLLGT